MDDIATLTELDLWFIEAFRGGSWELLPAEPFAIFLVPGWSHGEVWTEERYIENLRNNPLPSIEIDQVVIHIDGDVAVVSARSSSSSELHNRYVDTYTRGEDAWRLGPRMRATSRRGFGGLRPTCKRCNICP